MRAHGDNLYTNSVIAFSPNDGTLKWYYQTTPHDVRDYDGINEPILFRARTHCEHDAGDREEWRHQARGATSSMALTLYHGTECIL